MSRHSEALSELLGRPPMPAIIAAATEHPATVLCVGGAVRDALLGRPAADIDIAVAGELGEFVDAFARHTGRCPGAIGDPWRDTHRTILGDTQVDIGRMLGNEVEDLGQRDFTINAMAVRLPATPVDGEYLIDLHGGAEDLERRTITMLSEHALRSDPLRMLRAVRYTATLPGFAIDAATRGEIVARAATIESVAAERVQAEWWHLLAGPLWAEGVARMAELGLAEPTLGASCNLRDARCWAAFEAAGGAAEVPADDLPAVRLAALLPPEAAQHPADAQRRLLQRRWPLAPVRRACRVGSWSRRVGVVDDGELAGWALEDREAAQQAASLARALRGVAAATDRQSSDRHLADQRLEEGGDPDGEGRAIDVLAAYAQRAGEERWVRGADLRAWGMEPGPELGRLLEQTARGQLERRWYSAADARAWAMQCAAGQGRPADE